MLLTGVVFPLPYGQVSLSGFDNSKKIIGYQNTSYSEIERVAPLTAIKGEYTF